MNSAQELCQPVTKTGDAEEEVSPAKASPVLENVT
jgi:hypothetical protein